MPKLNAVPALRSQRRTLRLKQNIVFGLLGALCLTGPLALIITIRQDSPEAPAPLRDHLKASPYVIAFAQQVAEDYLSGEGTTLPVGGEKDSTLDRRFGGNNALSRPLTRSNLAIWNVERTTYVSKNSPAAESWRVTFSFQARYQNTPTRLADVVVDDAMLLITHIRLDQNGLPVLAATPSLIRDLLPGRSIGGDVGLIGLSGTEAPSLPPPAYAAIEAWVLAYVKDDASALKALVNAGSPRDDYAYRGLGGGFSSPANEASWSKIVAVVRGDGATAARIRLNLVRELDGYRVSTEMDLLLKNTDPAQVLAWGPVGSGDSLTPWQNGSPGR